MPEIKLDPGKQFNTPQYVNALASKENGGKSFTLSDCTYSDCTFCSILILYVGFLTWGLDTLEVVTNNLPFYSLKLIVNLILVCKAMLSYPLPFFASVELLEAALFKGKPRTCFPPCLDDSRRLKWWGLSLRLALVLFTCAMAIIIPHFALLMALIGSFTGTMLSFVWPCYFHLRLRWSTMPRTTRYLNIFIIALGLACGGIGIYYSAHALIRALQGLPPEPINIKVPG